MWRIYYNESYPWASNIKHFRLNISMVWAGLYLHRRVSYRSTLNGFAAKPTIYDKLWGENLCTSVTWVRQLWVRTWNSQIREAQKAKAPWTDVYAIQILLPTLHTPMPLFLTMPEQGLSQFVSHRPWSGVRGKLSADDAQTVTLAYFILLIIYLLLYQVGDIERHAIVYPLISYMPLSHNTNWKKRYGFNLEKIYDSFETRTKSDW